MCTLADPWCKTKAQRAPGTQTHLSKARNIIENDDYIDTRVRPNEIRTDPNSAFVGAGSSISMPVGDSKKLWALRRKLAKKKAFPIKLLKELGEDYFYKELKIPIDKYYHFLDYCNFKGIEDLYYNDKLLEVIKILYEESVAYLKTIKKD